MAIHRRDLRLRRQKLALSLVVRSQVLCGAYLLPGPNVAKSLGTPQSIPSFYVLLILSLILYYDTCSNTCLPYRGLLDIVYTPTGLL